MAIFNWQSQCDSCVEFKFLLFFNLCSPQCKLKYVLHLVESNQVCLTYPELLLRNGCLAVSGSTSCPSFSFPSHSFFLRSSLKKNLVRLESLHTMMWHFLFSSNKVIFLLWLWEFILKSDQPMITAQPYWQKYWSFGFIPKHRSGGISGPFSISAI